MEILNSFELRWQFIRAGISPRVVGQSTDLLIATEETESSLRGNREHFDCQDGLSSFPHLFVSSPNNGMTKNITLTVNIEVAGKTQFCGLSFHLIQKPAPLQVPLQGCQAGEIPPSSGYGSCSRCSRGVDDVHSLRFMN